MGALVLIALGFLGARLTRMAGEEWLDWEDPDLFPLNSQENSKCR